MNEFYVFSANSGSLDFESLEKSGTTFIYCSENCRKGREVSESEAQEIFKRLAPGLDFQEAEGSYYKGSLYE